MGLTDTLGPHGAYWLITSLLALTATRLHIGLAFCRSMTLLAGKPYFCFVSSLCLSLAALSLPDTLTGKERPAAIAVFFVVWLTSGILYLLLTHWLTRLRGWDDIERPEATKAVRQKEFVNVVGTRHEPCRSARHYYDTFRADLEDMRTNWPFAAPFEFTEDEITLMFFKGLDNGRWGEWRDGVASQYCIGGKGKGSVLSLEEMVELAEREERLPIIRKTLRLRCLPRVWRVWLQVAFFVMYPTVVGGVVASIWFL